MGVDRMEPAKQQREKSVFYKHQKETKCANPLHTVSFMVFNALMFK